MDHDETGCQAAPEGPILCVNNCGFFGSAANMNMCSKCYKDTILKQEQAKFAASSIENFVNESSKGSGKEPAAAATAAAAVASAAVAVASAAVAVADTVMQADPVEVQTISLPPPQVSSSGDAGAPKGNEGPSRCHSCKKRVGLTGFNCRCGYTFCGSHRYSDKHDCQFDYRAAAQDAIAKANPVIKAEKLDKI